MNEEENFLARWLRLKGEAADGEQRFAHPAEVSKDDGSKTVQATDSADFDIASLPAIDSITAATDVRAFLQSGVPAELTKAALRQLWTVDPAIRDFIGIAENQWDFTDPAGIPGFGPLDASHDLPKLVAQAMGDQSLSLHATEPADASQSVTTPVTGQSQVRDGNAATDIQATIDTPAKATATEVASDTDQALPETKIAASQQEWAPVARSHGSALPK
jgi:hypothetical protein